MFDGLTLVVPAKGDVERDAVCAQWQRHGGECLRLDRFWEPPSLDVSTVRLYGPDTFCLVVAQKLRLGLLSPEDGLLASLGRDLLKRDVAQRTLDDVSQFDFPLFVKPVVPKVFRAAVYDSPDLLTKECRGLPPDTAILTSEPVRILAEARSFILGRQVATCAVYEGEGSVADAENLANSFASECELPRTFVMDLARIGERGWAVLEFNATWGAGLNGCDPLAAASCILHATSVAA